MNGRGFAPRHVTFEGGFEVGAPAEDVFPLFSPEGERAWVPGWDPELLYPPGVTWERGLVFRTAGFGSAPAPPPAPSDPPASSASPAAPAPASPTGEEIWVVTRLDLENRQVEYHRVEPGRCVARIEVRCRPLGPRATAVAVAYTFVGLSADGNAMIAALTDADYRAKMRAWRDRLAALFPGSSGGRSGASREDTARSYDTVADEYVRRIAGELEGKPLDRALLDRFAGALRDAGPVADVGCGPGHVARDLRERGAEVIGVDLSPAMVRRAAELNPGIPFRVGDMTALAADDGAFAGVLAFYSLINLPRDEVVVALREFRRVLARDGQLLLAFHVGAETVALDTWWELPVRVDFCFFEVPEMEEYLRRAGFEVLETIVREPYAGVEHPSRRAYVFARPAR